MIPGQCPSLRSSDAPPRNLASRLLSKELRAIFQYLRSPCSILKPPSQETPHILGLVSSLAQIPSLLIRDYFKGREKPCYLASQKLPHSDGSPAIPTHAIDSRLRHPRMLDPHFSVYSRQCIEVPYSEAQDIPAQRPNFNP